VQPLFQITMRVVQADVLSSLYVHLGPSMSIYLLWVCLSTVHASLAASQGGGQDSGTKLVR
jgi:hypothetical protein